MTAEDERYLRLAGEVLADQTGQVVDHWRGRIIAGIPNLARHSRTPEGNAIPEYAAKSDLRFRQWILDTYLRPFRHLVGFLRAAHALCGRHHDVATASLIEVWIDQAERRTWFLAETLSGMTAENTK